MIGVTQVLNKRGGPFTDEDETRLKAFTAQMAIALENAKLFDDVQNMKNYNESMLESMSNGVITLDEEERIVTCNAAGAAHPASGAGGGRRPAGGGVLRRRQRMGHASACAASTATGTPDVADGRGVELRRATRPSPRT